MVSGFVTSPCDQLRIFSGEARLMRMASKSVTALLSSKGFERYKVFLLPDSRVRLSAPEWFCMLAHLPPVHFFAGPDRKHFRAGRNHELVSCGDACHLFLAFTGGDQLNVKTQRLQFTDQHVERLRHTRLDSSFALDDGLVDLGAAVNVVRFRREQLLQDVSRAVSF